METKPTPGRALVGTGERFRSQWRSRPIPLRIYVGTLSVSTLLSIVREPGQLASPEILVTIALLFVLKMLWAGSAGMWWLCVLASAAFAALALTAVSEHSTVWTMFAAYALSLVLLVHPSTRAWFNERIAERYP